MVVSVCLYNFVFGCASLASICTVVGMGEREREREREKNSHSQRERERHVLNDFLRMIESETMK